LSSFYAPILDLDFARRPLDGVKIISPSKDKKEEHLKYSISIVAPFIDQVLSPLGLHLIHFKP
jgi:hypothetical protein